MNLHDWYLEIVNNQLDVMACNARIRKDLSSKLGIHVSDIEVSIDISYDSTILKKIIIDFKTNISKSMLDQFEWDYMTPMGSFVIIISEDLL